MTAKTQQTADITAVLCYVLNKHVTTADLSRVLEQQEQWNLAMGIDYERLKRAAGYIEGLRAEGGVIVTLIDV